MIGAKGSETGVDRRANRGGGRLDRGAIACLSRYTAMGVPNYSGMVRGCGAVRKNSGPPEKGVPAQAGPRQYTTARACTNE